VKNKMAVASQKISKRELDNAKLSTDIATQGIVLLENKGILPFNKTVKSIALFGSGARRTIKGGTGSGDVNVRSFVTVEQGFINMGFNVVTTPYMNAYDVITNETSSTYYRKIKEVSKQGTFIGLVTMMKNPFIPPLPELLSKETISGYMADAAVYVFSRNSGEGADRKAESGDYYLTEQEISDISLLSEFYSKFVLLLNVGGVIDLSKIIRLTGIGAIVLMSQGGSGCGDAVVAVLAGNVTPSGKLTATWAMDYKDYPLANEFATVGGDIFDTYYKEGVYVGYRYFDTFGVNPLYPFGFGRSYTEFTIHICSASLRGSKVVLEIFVKNKGDKFSGREVVQVYISIPSKNINKPYQVLAAFQKTKELVPGETQVLTLSFPLEQLASFDESRAVWILEDGDYVLRCGNSSMHTYATAIITIPESIITQQCKNMFRSEVVEEFTPPSRDPIIQISGVFHLVVDVKCIQTNICIYPLSIFCSSDRPNITFNDVKIGKATAEELVSCLTADELAALCVGAARFNLTDVSIVGNFSDAIPGAAGETTSFLKKYGIPQITMVDGPAGIRINPIVHEKDGEYIKNPEEDPIFRYTLQDGQINIDLSNSETKYQYCTALPIATMLAQTWDMELLERAGRLIGAEMSELGVELWLAPSLNIQRNPLCGRNFEYYSEDPLLSGFCAAAVVKGVQSHVGKGATIKHFAANNQETNRNYNNSVVSERVLREIYLKGFEICVREAKPFAVMTSLNLINGVHAATDRDLLIKVLRDEWGFDGVVMTDWGTTGIPGNNKDQKYDCSFAVHCIDAGNDLIMPGSQRDYDYIVTAIKTGELKISELQYCAANVIKLLVKTALEVEDGNLRRKN